MSDFQVKADAVDVEAIMRQIRARVREKRGVDYTEAEVQELAQVKLEQFLDPKGLRSDLVGQFRRRRGVSPAPPNYAFEDSTIYETHRGLLRAMRRLLNPLLKLFFNPDRISEALHVQARVNDVSHQRLRALEEMDSLYYELVHNLALEVTRLGIEVHNMKMRVESLSSRMDFDERRGRALESVVQYRQPRQTAPRPAPSVPPIATAAPAAVPAETMAVAGDAGDQGTPADRTASADGERRRRRRRRRRRPGQTLADQSAAAPETAGTDTDAETADFVAEGGPDTGSDTQDSGPDEQ